MGWWADFVQGYKEGYAEEMGLPPPPKPMEHAPAPIRVRKEHPLIDLREPAPAPAPRPVSYYRRDYDNDDENYQAPDRGPGLATRIAKGTLKHAVIIGLGIAWANHDRNKN